MREKQDRVLEADSSASKKQIPRWNTLATHAKKMFHPVSVVSGNVRPIFILAVMLAAV